MPERLCSRPHLEKGAKGTSEMVYRIMQVNSKQATHDLLVLMEK